MVRGTSGSRGRLRGPLGGSVESEMTSNEPVPLLVISEPDAPASRAPRGASR